MSLIQWIPFSSIQDGRGSLVVIEGGAGTPFDIKRVYYMSGMAPGNSRGYHAHKELQQVAVCISGSCTMLLDDGRTKQTVVLSDAGKGLLVDRMIWHEMHEFSQDCVLMVLASDHYDETDYIRDYQKFLDASDELEI